ncbi:UDP-N-acetylmuramate dehydrogenase [Marinagarivorans algicola]|uniref:UDP-N-acetylmuramate dehydrogenase n=1 Tax=Marinagarivorans algicola TaxID=1513270 RepID=UPI0006B8BB14|nr:UDP-N-acetylmuramate dehydrogenase [Marinagarivorans algicola]
MLLSHFKHQFDISHLNTMGMPCRAEHFIAANNETELESAIKTAQQHHLALHILGGGSNVLCQPYIHGLVLVPALKGIEVKSEVGKAGAHEVLVTVNAGENWHKLVIWSLANGYFGLENLALIPGCVGAAPIQNIGAYGVELADVLDTVKWLDCNTGLYHTFSAAQCELAYRDSIFKRTLKGRAVITQITLRLSTQACPIIHYKPLADHFKSKPVSAQLIFEEVCKQRNSKLPNPQQIPNSGSFFKNPIIDARTFEQLSALARDKWACEVPHYLQPDGTIKIPAAWLIDKAELKGADIEGLKVHDRQALVLTNPNKKPLNAVLDASDFITSTIRQRFGITLEREPQILG